jgi:O-methyltransferase
VTDRNGLADDYLELLKGALTHTLYAEVDGGINYRRNILGRALFRALKWRQIVPVRTGPLAERERMQGNDWPVFAQTMTGRARIDNLQHCIEDIIRDGVPGDIIETGVWRGGSSIFMRGVLKVHGVTDRSVWVCDSFEGLPPPEPGFAADAGAIWHWWKPLSVSLEAVTANFARYGLLDDQVCFVKGWFKDTLPGLHDERWSLIRLDGDMYQSTIDALEHLYPRLSPGGYLVIDDYWGVEACRQAVHDYRDKHGVHEPIKRIDWSGVYWRRELPTD